MSHHFVEIKTLILTNNFIVKIYTTETETDIPTTEAIDVVTDILNQQTYPRGIVEALEVFTSLAKVEIYDANNQLVLVSSKDIETA